MTGYSSVGTLWSARRLWEVLGHLALLVALAACGTVPTSQGVVGRPEPAAAVPPGALNPDVR